MKLIDRVRRNPPMSTGESLAQRSGLVTLYETWQGNNYNETIADDFVSFVQDGIQANAALWALVLVRMVFFSQIEFVYQDMKTRDTDFNPTLSILRSPWTNGSTQELLARMELDASTAGNAYVYRATPTTLQRLRPDWVEIVTDGSQVMAYKYTRGGPSSSSGQRDFKMILPDEMCHWCPLPDPMANFRGMSWITPVIREVMADKKMTRHKEKFFDNAATPNLLIKNTKNLDEESRERLRTKLDERHTGVEAAYKTLVLEGGADATIIGSTMQQMSFDPVQAAGENRIAAAAGVPGIVAGFKEGLQAATYSNYAQAKRHFVDGLLTYNWGSVSKALETLVKPDEDSRLWYDASRIPALKEDRKDQADITLAQAQAMQAMVRAGWEPDDVEQYVLTGERPQGGLHHTGMIFFQGAEAEPGSGLVSEAPGGGAGDPEDPTGGAPAVAAPVPGAKPAVPAPSAGPPKQLPAAKPPVKKN